MSSVPPPIPPQQTFAPGMPPPYPIPHNANVDASGIVTADSPCRKCAYNLRGLSVEGRCPECGTAVGMSIHGDLLRFSEPSWVRTLEQGARLIIMGIAIIILGVILIMVVGFVLPAILYLSPVISVGGYIVMLVGVWRLTEPDPSGIGEDQYGTARRIIRIALVVGLVNTALSNMPRGAGISPGASVAISVLAGIAGLIGLVGQFAQLHYLSKLALRIPSIELSKRARFLMWGIGISYGIVILGGLIVAITGVRVARGGAAPGGGAGGVMAAGGCIAGLAALALLIFAIMYLFMLDRLRRAFGEQAQAAEQTWARAGAAAA